MHQTATPAMHIYRRRPAESEIPEYYRNYVRQTTGDDIEFMLDESRRETIAFLRLLPAEKWDYRYAPEKWTIREVILHLIDSERVFAYRILRIGRGDKTPLAGFDQNDYVPSSNAEQRSEQSLITEYRAVREGTLQLIKNFTPQMWEGKGTASGAEISALAIAYIIAGHEAHHLRIIRERYL